MNPTSRNPGWSKPDSLNLFHYFPEGQIVALCARAITSKQRSEITPDIDKTCDICERMKREAEAKEGARP